MYGLLHMSFCMIYNKLSVSSFTFIYRILLFPKNKTTNIKTTLLRQNYLTQANSGGKDDKVSEQDGPFLFFLLHSDIIFRNLKKGSEMVWTGTNIFPVWGPWGRMGTNPHPPLKYLDYSFSSRWLRASSPYGAHAEESRRRKEPPKGLVSAKLAGLHSLPPTFHLKALITLLDSSLTSSTNSSWQEFKCMQIAFCSPLRPVMLTRISPRSLPCCMSHETG